MSTELATLILFGGMLVLLATGAPFAFVIGGTALILTWIIWGAGGLNMAATQTLGVMRSTVLLALPLFYMMAIFLEKSGIADDLYELMYNLLGRIKGGLAVGTVLVCTIFAACAGISGASTVTMGLIALPSMLKRGYDKRIACGCISAGGALGVLIPPSVTFLIYGVMAEVSIGRLFAGGLLPGLLLSVLFVTYILVRCHLNPTLGPPIPPEERLPLKKIIPQFKALILPILLVIAVLGSILSGIATPTEASAVGALGAMVSAAVKGRFNGKLVMESSRETLKLAAMVLWIVVAASWFSTLYNGIGGPAYIKETVQSFGLNRWFVLIGIQILLIILGCVMETTGIIMITVPMFIPLILMFKFDPVWFGVLFVMNMEMGFLTPPFGVNLFYMKAVAPKGVTMLDLYKSIIPFVLLQLTGLVIVMLFPQIALAVPNALFGK
ncbi:MAG: TRAP transporter large permease subunit [Dehalococcoidales bacterium]|nr:TRAP transporter large permease subunit [Dehalococcoidales bacterium]